MWPIQNDAKNLKNDWNETLAHGYLSESTQQELSNEYQHDKVWMVFKNLCILMFGMKFEISLSIESNGMKLIPKKENSNFRKKYPNPFSYMYKDAIY